MTTATRPAAVDGTDTSVPEHTDLRSFIAACQAVDEWRQVDGAERDLEIAALTEATSELIPEPPMLLFDNIPGFPPGYRVVSLLLASARRTALALGLPLDRPKLELVRLAARKIGEATMLPPREVADGPVMENVLQGDAVDLLRFPAPWFHPQDGGRYLGVGHAVISRDPDSGYVNMGTYRIQLHDRDRLGLWMSPGQHARLICQRFWERGQSCPVVAAFGIDPVTFMASHNKIPWGQSELAFAGGLRGRPLDVIPGPLTGLPIPAQAEIVVEGEVPPPSEEARDEGPFGEWPGYASGGTLGTGESQPVIRVKAIYHRGDPILLNAAPMWPGAPNFGLPLKAGLLWDQLERAGIQDVTGVYQHSSYMVVVAIKQRYAGHAKQAGLAALSASATARNGRYVVVVDDDIDPTDIQEVLWAMETRCDPATAIDIVDGCWSTPLDPVMSPAKRAARDHTNSRAVFYAVRPFAWRDQYPPVSRSPRDLRERVVRKYRDLLPFPTANRIQPWRGIP